VGQRDTQSVLSHAGTTSGTTRRKPAPMLALRWDNKWDSNGTVPLSRPTLFLGVGRWDRSASRRAAVVNH